MVVTQAPSGAARPPTFPITPCARFLEQALLCHWPAPPPASVPTMPGSPPPPHAAPRGTPAPCTLTLQGAWRPASGCLPVCSHLPKACGLSKDDGLIIVLFPLQSTVPGT